MHRCYAYPSGNAHKPFRKLAPHRRECLVCSKPHTRTLAHAFPSHAHCHSTPPPLFPSLPRKSFSLHMMGKRSGRRVSRSSDRGASRQKTTAPPYKLRPQAAQPGYTGTVLQGSELVSHVLKRTSHGRGHHHKLHGGLSGPADLRPPAHWAQTKRGQDQGKPQL